MFGSKRIAELEERIRKLEEENLKLQDKTSPWFAEKRVQHLVYAAIGLILTAAVTSFVGGVPWLNM